MKSAFLLTVGLLKAVVPEASLQGPVYLVCYSSQKNSPVVWNWAIDAEKYLEIKGTWLTDRRGKQFFLAHQNTHEDLKKSCKDTITKQRAEEASLTGMRAGLNSFSPDYQIRFLGHEKDRTLRALGNESSKIIEAQFVPLIKKILDAPDRSQIISNALIKYVSENQESRSALLPYLREAKEYSKITGVPLDWKSTEESEQVLEFIEGFKGLSDFQILSHSMPGEKGGLSRGALNSYIDLVTDSFRPDEKTTAALAFYEGTNSEHRLLYLASEVFNQFSALKGINNKVPTILKVGDIRDLNEYTAHVLAIMNMAVASLKKVEQAIGDAAAASEIHQLTRRFEDMIVSATHTL